MYRKPGSMIWLCCLLLFSSQAQAILITDRWSGDQNTITASFQDDVNHIFHWEEDYNEDNLIPYPSTGGYAVVNAPGNPGCPAGTEACYFDKVLTLEGESGIWEFQIGVFNTPQSARFKWSDYHFEFYDPLFQQPLDNALLDVQNDIFSILEIMPDAVWLSGGTQFPGQHNLITVISNLDPFGGVGSIGIRQVATTPEPTTLALLSLGLAGLGLAKKRIAV